MREDCGNPYCRAHGLTVSEFEALGGERWSQSFRIRMGQRAKKLYGELYSRKNPKKGRTIARRGFRNETITHHCGILEQAYKALLAEGVKPDDPGENRTLKAHMRAIERRAARAAANSGAGENVAD